MRSPRRWELSIAAENLSASVRLWRGSGDLPVDPSRKLMFRRYSEAIDMLYQRNRFIFSLTLIPRRRNTILLKRWALIRSLVLYGSYGSVFERLPYTVPCRKDIWERV